MAQTRLAQERTRRGESTYEVAGAVGVSQSHYFRVEDGETFASPEVAEKLAAHFGLTLTELFRPARYTAYRKGSHDEG